MEPRMRVPTVPPNWNRRNISAQFLGAVCYGMCTAIQSAGDQKIWRDRFLTRCAPSQSNSGRLSRLPRIPETRLFLRGNSNGDSYVRQ